MKKLLVAIALSLSLMIAFASCGGAEDQSSTNYNTMNSLGDITYELPEGYEYDIGNNDFIIYKKAVNDKLTRRIYVTKMSQKHLQDLDSEYSSPEEAYNAEKPAEDDPDAEFGTIAGYEGYTYISPYYEDEQIHAAYTAFMADDILYDIELGTYDDEENPSYEVPLSDEEIEEYKAFIASIKKK